MSLMLPMIRRSSHSWLSAMGIFIPLVTLVVLLTSCGSATDQSSSSAELPSVPLLTTKPANPQALSAIKSSAKPGDEVIFQARIGGRLEPMLANHAAAIVADATVLSACDVRPGDNCPYPWDFCCEPKEAITANTAMIQFVNEYKKPLAHGFAELTNLNNGDFVIAQGVVASTEGSYVINLSGLYHDVERKPEPISVIAK